MVRLPHGFPMSNRAISKLSNHNGYLSPNHRCFLLVVGLYQCCVMPTREDV